MQFQYSYRKISKVKFLLVILTIFAGYSSVWTQQKELRFIENTAEMQTYQGEFSFYEAADLSEDDETEIEAPEDFELSNREFLAEYKFFEYNEIEKEIPRREIFIKPEIQKLVDEKEKKDKFSIDEAIEEFKPAAPTSSGEKFHWKPAILESLYLLGIQHTYRMFQRKTYTELDGPFFRDWANSVKNLGGWRDGDSLLTNYVAHPMQGAVTGRIFINNSDKDNKLEFGKSEKYWQSRLKAMAWSTVWSIQFELGPISEATIGNVGLYDKVGPNRMAWVDLVITPTAGTGVLIVEDMVDKYILKKWLEKDNSRTRIKVFRSFLTPLQAFTNLLAGKAPWWRYNR